MLSDHQDDIPSNGNRSRRAWIKKTKKRYIITARIILINILNIMRKILNHIGF